MAKFGMPSESFHGTCRDLTFEGKGVVVDGKRTVFVNGVFPGESGEFEIAYRRNGSFYGRVKRLDVVSPDRIAPKCKICSSCGGCQFQQYAYKAQLEYKTKKVKEQFRKIAHMDVDVLPTIGMDDPYHYRNKIQMPFGKDARGNIYCGFYKENTHIIVPVTECYIEDKRAAKILQTVKKLMKSFRIEPYDEDARSGVLRHLLIRTSHYAPEIMVVLVTNVNSFPSRNNFVHELVKECPEITTVVQNINTRQTNVILGERERVLYGPGKIRDSLNGVEFNISAKSFYQTNTDQAYELYKVARNFAGLTGNELVYDLYTGTGTIANFVAKQARQVIGIEYVPEAIEDAKVNSDINGISNTLFYAGDMKDILNKEFIETHGRPDVIITDPPRAGMHQDVIDTILFAAPQRIVYVSCNPATQARDLQLLDTDYKVTRVQPVDMFPHTQHVENVVLLEKR